jgi:hypothetical protein
MVILSETESVYEYLRREHCRWGYKWRVLYQLAPVAAGVKPAAILNIARERVEEFLKTGKEMMAGKDVYFKAVRESNFRILFFVYSRETVQTILDDPDIRAFFDRQGFGNSRTVNTLVTQMIRILRMGKIPHEIGVILGIPLKDVRGFLGLSDEKQTGMCMWRFYGDPKPSWDTAHRIRSARERLLLRHMGMRKASIRMSGSNVIVLV